MIEAIQAADGAALLFIERVFRADWLSPVMVFYTRLGNAGLLWIALCLALLCFKRTRRAGLLGLFSMLLGMLCTNVILKHLVARPRPFLSVPGLAPLLPPPDPNSFPSGHTCAAFAFAGAMRRALPARRGGIAALCAAVLMGLSRLYVGLHFPSDVIAGMLVGLLCSRAARHLLEMAESRWKNQRSGNCSG